MPKYKDGKKTVQMDFQDFSKALNRKDCFVSPLRDKSFLALLFWTGLRKSEILERTKKDFTIKGGKLFIDAPPKKGGKRLKLKIDVDLPFVDLILKQISKARKTKADPKRHVWPISAWTAWKIVKRVFPNHYPHYFRLNRATTFLNDPTTTQVEMKSWFGWKSVKTIDSYVGISERGIETQSKRLRKEIPQ